MSRIKLRKFWKLLLGILLIAGTAMGGGMIGLPIFAGLGGFLPAFLLTTLVWVCVLACSYYYLELTLSLPDGANVLSFTEHYSGKLGKIFVGIPFFLFYFCVIVSYPAICVPILIELIKISFGMTIPIIWGYVLAGGAFALVIAFGLRASLNLNILLMTGFFITFFLSIFHAQSHVQPKLLAHQDWTFTLLAAPVLFTSFSFCYNIPTLATFLNRDVKAIKTAIFVGLLIIYLCYVVWEVITIGTWTQGEIWAAFERGDAVSEGIKLIRQIPWFGKTTLFFTFFAIITSVLGVGVSFIDGISDGLKWSPSERLGWRRLILTLIIFVIALFLAYLFPTLFFEILGYGGGFGFILTTAVFPIVYTWKARYMPNSPVIPIVPGGRLTLFVLLILVLYTMYIQGILLIH